MSKIYRNEDQLNNVVALVQHILNFCEANNVFLSKETLTLAVDRYCYLTDAPVVPEYEEEKQVVVPFRRGPKL